MKRSILTLLLSSLLWVACDRDDTPHEFVDNRLIEIIDDGNAHTWMRLANATGRPICIVYLRPGDDIPEICPCPPWHTVVCHVAAEEEAAPAAAFAGIKVFYDSEVMDAGISMSFSDFGRSTPNPDPGDASQWTRRELAERNVVLTYVFDGEDYDLACRKGKRH